jgi:CheY-like chemotaxis protein
LEDPEHGAVVKRCLEDAGYEVAVANSLAKAKAMLHQHPFDLIISDVHLDNGGSIFDFLRWAKCHDHYGAIPLALFSLAPSNIAKHLADGVRAAARHLGAAKYISMDKFHSGLFSQAIKELLPGEVAEGHVGTDLAQEDCAA